jgi:hypothetical protein
MGKFYGAGQSLSRIDHTIRREGETGSSGKKGRGLERGSGREREGPKIIGAG